MSPDVAASIKARLLARAKAASEEFERTLNRFAGERLLYRLGASEARDRCLLKGASLLSVWLPDPYRATRDVDLLASGTSDEESVRALVEEICAVPCPSDGLHFDLSTMAVQEIRAEVEYAGCRVRFVALLGKARIHVQIDVGFGAAAGRMHEEVEIPVLLKGLPAPRLRAYPREASIAEKFQAMVELDVRNSRMKDFHDVWALSRAFAFEGPSLQRAISTCFDRRRSVWTSEEPSALTATFYQRAELEARWRRYLAAGSILVPPPSSFGDIGEQIRRFLAPVRESVLEGRTFGQHWPAGGPWGAGTRNHERAGGDV